jgi:hypothetical protein
LQSTELLSSSPSHYQKQQQQRFQPKAWWTWSTLDSSQTRSHITKCHSMSLQISGTIFLMYFSWHHSYKLDNSNRSVCLTFWHRSFTFKF